MAERFAQMIFGTIVALLIDLVLSLLSLIWGGMAYGTSQPTNPWVTRVCLYPVLMGWLFFRPTSSAPQTKPSEPLLPPNLDDRPPPRIPGT